MNNFSTSSRLYIYLIIQKSLTFIQVFYICKRFVHFFTRFTFSTLLAKNFSFGELFREFLSLLGFITAAEQQLSGSAQYCLKRSKGKNFIWKSLWYSQYETKNLIKDRNCNARMTFDKFKIFSVFASKKATFLAGFYLSVNKPRRSWSNDILWGIKRFWVGVCNFRVKQFSEKFTNERQL